MTATPIPTVTHVDSVEDKLLALACSERLAKANLLVKNFTLASAAIALVPLPLIDQVALISLELKMIHQLTKIYDVPFKPNIAISIISSLLSGITSGLFARALQSFSKLVPLFATVGSGSIAISSASVTFALGNVFIKHFEDNGTFLNINFEWFRNIFFQQLGKPKDNSQTIATELTDDHFVSHEA
jgi:uncharacterized protein (DUF697 family)